ncbi:MAG: RsmE family RNA methyltransferase [Gemmatimonadota bacterium]
MVGCGGTPGMIVLAPRARIDVGVTLELDQDEAHHLRVRRAEQGMRVGIRNGVGLVGLGELVSAEVRSARVLVTEVSYEQRPPTLELLVASGDKDRFGWLVEKAAELGVTDIVPVDTERSRGVATRVGAAQISRLAVRALEATKQSGAAWAPVVAEPVSFAGAISRGANGCRWLADADGEWLSAAAGQLRGDVSVLIGPEGGFTQDERAAAFASGWHPTRLAARVLRFETAAIVAAAAIALARGGGAHD